ncbi:unnamed protein product [Caenorhabditis auriculariae]|uniref:Uncharacterized protein n=1 Tax=Caenorhabditis auriculariae TaxID=2777116 RepID=A0A8S1GQM7_9PELO|nr:unnamed protein product [Caenorhabditis auriculariae]
MLRAISTVSRSSIRSIAISAQSSAEAPSKHEVDELFADKSRSSQQNQPRRRHAFSTNKVELVGGVALDPVLRQTKNNRPYLLMNVITNHSLKNTDGSYFEETERHAVTYFGPQAENLSKIIRKGNRVMVLGRLHYSGGKLEESGNRTPRNTFIRADTIQQLAKPQNQDEQ